LLSTGASAAREEACTEREGSVAEDDRVPARIVRRLYVSHFLSTWNSRVFEFGAVLYLATIFPGTLLPMSVYAFTRGLSAIVFAPAVGQYIDSSNRLQVVRVSIVVQRLVVAGSCVIFFLMARNVYMGPGEHQGMMALLAFFACLEKLCSIMNLVAVEKDWVAVVAGPYSQEALRIINAQMRRIDLICKLLGPLFIALIDGVSTESAIVVNFGLNLAAIIIEYFAIAKVYHEVPDLQVPKRKSIERTQSQDRLRAEESRLMHNWRHVQNVVKKSGTDFAFYFDHRAFLPSFAGALLYLTVLNFAGQMVTYLLSAGYNSTQIAIARTFSVAFEVLATWVAPWLMARIGTVRAGLWFSDWQVTTLVTGLVVFWTFFYSQPVISASGLVIGTIISRVGLRGFDLCVQIIVQEEVEPIHRGAFSSVEAACQNAFELLSYASTMVFARPAQFKYPTLFSVIAVTLASLCYSLFVRLRRGHLIHPEALSNCFSTEKGEQRKRARIVEREEAGGDV